MEVEVELRAVGADVLDFRSLPLEGKKQNRKTRQICYNSVTMFCHTSLSVNHSVSLKDLRLCNCSRAAHTHMMLSISLFTLFNLGSRQKRLLSFMVTLEKWTMEGI